MDAAAKALLLEALKREDEVQAAQAPQHFGGHFRERVRLAGLRLRLGDQLEHGPHWSSVDWLKAYTPAERMAAGRLLKRLEAAGLVVVRRLGGQASNVKLTPFGRETAEALRLEAAEAAKESDGA